MGKSRYKVDDQYQTYFVSSTVVDWLPIFTTEKYFQVLIKSLQFKAEIPWRCRASPRVSVKWNNKIIKNENINPSVSLRTGNQNDLPANALHYAIQAGNLKSKNVLRLKKF